MPTFELPKEYCGTLVGWLKGFDLTKAMAEIGPTSVSDNSALVQALAHLRDALGTAVTNTFDATITLSILNQAEKGALEDKSEQRPHVRRLLEYGYLVGSGPDNHGTMRISGLHEHGRPLRDFLEWWRDRP
jgi:hypothetical protein